MARLVRALIGRATLPRPHRELPDDRRCDLLLSASSGGHLLQLLLLRDAWRGYDLVWVVAPTRDAESLLAEERVVFAYGPGTRNPRALVKNVFLAWRTVSRLRPKVVVTTGAGVSVPFAWVGRLRGARLVFIETLTRIHSPSLTYRFLAPIADRVYVQWPELEALPRARYAGSVVGAPQDGAARS
jgi:beta-1,4-N-acetylglucosaminyltransferase